MVITNPGNTYKEVVKKASTPTYIYSERILKNNAITIFEAAEVVPNQVSLFIPYFTNSNPHLFQILGKLGCGATIQSVEEHKQLKKYDSGMPTIVSATHLSREDLAYFIQTKIPVNVATTANLEQLLASGSKDIRIRLDLSPDSDQRQGFKPDQLPLIYRKIDEHNATLAGAHIYLGTQSKLDTHLHYMRKTLALVKNVKEINLGGGFSFNYDESDPKKKHFDWKSYFSQLRSCTYEFEIAQSTRFILEPGRDVFADAGEFIVQVKGIEKIHGKESYQVYTDGSYVHIPSATIRARQHKMRFFDDNFQELNYRTNRLTAKLSGNTTLSSDYLFPGAVYIPAELKEGDFIVLQDAGAYCATQHMEFLNKRPCAEVLVRDNILFTINRRGDYDDKTRNVPMELTAL